MKKLLLIFCVSGNMLLAQNLNLDWVKGIGNNDQDYIANMVQTSNGEFIIAGSFSGTVNFDSPPNTNLQTAVGQNDIFFAKYDANGSLAFVKTIGGIEGEHPQQVKIDQNNNIYIVGLFKNSVDFDPSANIYNLTTAPGVKGSYFAKYNSAGDLVYAKLIGNEYTYITDIAIDANFNVVIVGSVGGTASDFDPSAGTYNLTGTSPSYTGFIAKYDINGAFIFASLLDNTGNAGSDIIWIKFDTNNNIVVSGYHSGSTDFDPSTGSYTLPVTGSENLFFAKYSSSGNFIYAKDINANGSEGIPALMLDASNNIYIASRFELMSFVDPEPSTGLHIINTDASTNFLAVLTKYDPSGNFMDAWKFESPGNNFANIYAMGLDNSNNIYLTGTYKGTVDFDFSGNSLTHQSVGFTSDIFIAKYDPSGNYIYSESMGGNGDDYAVSLILTNDGNIVVSGNYSSTCDFDPNAGNVSLTANGTNPNIFIAKYADPFAGIKDPEGLSETLPYPNPFSDDIYLNNIPADSDVRLINELGIPVLSTNTSAGNSINTQSLSSGCYIVEISSEGKTSRSKMIKY
jgi:hypothetical protein